MQVPRDAPVISASFPWRGLYGLLSGDMVGFLNSVDWQAGRRESIVYR
jgi:hypothetical protein